MKDLRLSGVGDTIKLGKGGPALRRVDASTLEVLLASLAGFTNLKVKTPVNANDVANKDWLIDEAALGTFSTLNTYVSNTSGIDVQTLPDISATGLESTWVFIKNSPYQSANVLRIAPFTGQKITFNNSAIEGTGITNPSDMITNGTFPSNITSWFQNATSTTAATWSAGTLASVAGGGYFEYSQDVAGLTVGKSYTATCDVVSKTGARPAGLRLRNTSNTLLEQGQNWSLGSISNSYRDIMVFTATATTMRIGLGMDRNAGGQTVAFDNVVLTESPSGFIEIRNPNYPVYLTATSLGVWTVTSMAENVHNSYALFGRDTWVNKTANPTARRELAGFLQNGYGYTTCGFVATYSAVHTQYNDSANTWATMTANPTARRGHTSMAFNGFGYIVCGYTGAVSAVNTRYNDSANTWSTLTANSTARYSPVGFALNGYGYITTGDTTGVGAYTTVHNQYNDSADTWTAKTAFPTARQGVGSFSLNGYGYTSCGYNGAPLSNTEQYNDTANAWIARASNPLDRYSVSYFTLNGYGHVVSGNNGAVLGTNNCYNDATNSWITKALATTARDSAAGFDQNGYGYVSNGFVAANSAVHEQYN